MNQISSHSQKEEFLHLFHSGGYPMLNGNGTEVDFDNVINFENGLPGFEILTSFIIVPLNEYPPFQVLQSLEAPEVSMLVMPSNLIELGDELMPTKDNLDSIMATGIKDFETFVILKVNGDIGKFTANTKAPVIINHKQRLGMQIILDHPALDMEHPLELTE